ncbi:sugar ABC transporter ATP-binding protein [Mesorhizobium sp. VK23B]|uniref:Sugar ABC transporter ATP-binding protein n=1 Tax=Mesorhizobium dulcispinae TaxID=3072316 RepID=A0ABU4XF51_9HYPH|nr:MULTISPECIES: sugar ABC transporter ATP-binding protein [unclassified Mesorhizobium]MDX8464932.1 sugar ABC transporter ATP-binding protein [Mesorhizobium sp. VK23B]MDX8472851.1 sugar ABC transporter ATP-binding protein [Mesorhizobium sp. VK23A]
MTAPVVSIENVSKRFGDVQALRDVSAAFNAGEITALIGENGAGKSTLMRVLEGEHRPDAGRLLVDGQPVQLSSPRAAHGAGIRVIHQEPEIIPELTVAENIFIGDIKARAGLFLDRADLERRSLELLGTFGVVDVLSPGQRCHGLSPALRQLIEIMRALRPGARLLAFDEPTSSLTEDEAQRLFRVIRRLKADGVAVIYISHRLREIIELADRCVVMRDGSHVADEPIAALDEQRMVRLMVGRPVSDLFNRRERALGPVRLALEGVTTRRVEGISFAVRAGEIVGLGGLVGAGRTEVARAIVGLDPLLSGQMTVGGRPYKPCEPADAVAAGIGLVPEDRKQEALLLMQAVRDNVSLVVPDKVSRYGFFSRRRERALVARHVAELRVKTPSIEQAVGKLSGGNQQKVVFARWQACGPAVLILDEPTRGIDVGAKAEIYRLIESLADQGLAILLISSEMPELLGLADRVLVMQSGRISGELPWQEASEEAVLALAMRSGKETIIERRVS